MSVVVREKLQEITVDVEYIKCCRYCMQIESQDHPLYKRCKCDKGYFHNQCFVEWIQKFQTLECDICSKDFNDVIFSTRPRVLKGQRYIVISFVLNAAFVALVWIFYHNSISVECEHHKNDLFYNERCLNYAETRDQFYYANIFISLMMSIIWFIVSLYMRQIGIVELEYDRIIVIQ